MEARALEVIPEAEEPRHLCGRTEILRVAEPGIHPVKTHLARHVPQARADLGERARRLGIPEHGGKFVRPRGELAVVAGVGVAEDGVPQPVASHSSIGARADFFCPANGRFSQL